MIYSRIAGTGRYLPERILTNADLEKMVDTSDEWIRTRTGVERRHIASRDQTTSDLCVEAARVAIDKRTWRILAYIGLQFVLGSAYVLAILGAVGLSFVFFSVPFTQELIGEGVLMLGGDAVLLPRWTYPLCALGGVLLLTAFMHFARWLGQRHARLAKRLLVQE